MAHVIAKGILYCGAHLSRKTCSLSRCIPPAPHLAPGAEASGTAGTHVRRDEAARVRQEGQRADAERAPVLGGLVALVPGVEQARRRVRAHGDEEGREVRRPGAGRGQAGEEDAADHHQHERRREVEAALAEAVRRVGGGEHGEGAAGVGRDGEQVRLDGAVAEARDDLREEVRGHLEE